MKLPNSLRDQFKTPLGVLLPIGEDNKENIQKHISKNSYVITVGDQTTEKMINFGLIPSCLLYTSPSPRDATLSRMPSSA